MTQILKERNYFIDNMFKYDFLHKKSWKPVKKTISLYDLYQWF